ncbi:actin-domain-containing protein [Melampsora americana]|nr:actin-domain-containing protein [Melampsora americana]
MSTPTQALSPIRGFNRTPLQSRQLSSSSNLNPNTIPPGPSPAYTTNLRSRHALYGTDDRVVLDLGSKVWKAGFSSETKPRIVISTQSLCACESIWNLSSNSTSISISQDAISIGLRRLFFDYLMVDPKMRKVLLIESALIPIEVRSQISLVLFEHLHVPSISFTPSPVLVLLATGTVTGLVIDVGNLETSALPVYLSRPLFPLVRSTTRASSRLNSRLRSLLLRFAPLIPIPKFGQSSNSSSATTSTDRKISIPREFLTSEVIEDIKTRLLFVSKEPLKPFITPTDLETVPIASPTPMNTLDSMSDYSEELDTVLLDSLERHYKNSTSSETIDITYKLPTLQTSTSNPRAPSMGVIKIPGWIRERAAEILFSKSDDHQIPEEEEESWSVTEVVLECLANLPIDLRKPMVSNLVIAGGGAMIPGFIPRLKTELIQSLESAQSQLTMSLEDSNLPRHHKAKRGLPRYHSISSLSSSIHILNDPYLNKPIPTFSLTRPASFQPHLLSWIGGSLAGAMRIGGQEVIREHWDSVIEASLVSQEFAIENQEEMEEDGEEEDWERRLVGLRIAFGILPDWTKIVT